MKKLIPFIILFFGSYGWATTYTAGSGSDAASCVADPPTTVCASIQYIFDNTNLGDSAGDRIELDADITENTVWGGNDYGSSEANRVVIDLNGHTITATGSNDGIYVAVTAGYATIRNGKILNPTRDGVFVLTSGTANADGVIVENIEVQGHGRHGINLRAGSGYTLSGIVRDCYVHDGGGTTAGHGITTNNSTTDRTSGWTDADVNGTWEVAETTQVFRLINVTDGLNLVEETTTCEDGLDAGEWCWESDVLYVRLDDSGSANDHTLKKLLGTTDVDIYDNIVKNQTRPAGTEGMGIAFDDFSSGEIYRNRIEGSSGHGVTCNYCDVAVIRNNFVIDSGDDSIRILPYSRSVSVLNNTLHDAIDDNIDVDGNDTTVTLTNNLCDTSGQYAIEVPASGTVTTGSNNLTANYTTGAVSNFTNTDGVDSDPLFQNAAGGNFRLKFNSPAKDAGLGSQSFYVAGYKDACGNIRAYGSWYIGACDYRRPSSIIMPFLDSPGVVLDWYSYSLHWLRFGSDPVTFGSDQVTFGDS